jgi:flagellar basal-body rod modification protein FlgD
MPSDITTRSVAGIAQTSSTETKRASDISMDDFLKILAATMSNPSFSGESSGGGTDYISQLVQFTTLEQLNELSETVMTSVILQQQQQAFGLINKEVTVVDGEEKITGVIEKVRFSNGYATIVVNGKEYNMSAIDEIGGEPTGETTEPTEPTEPGSETDDSETTGEAK